MKLLNCSKCSDEFGYHESQELIDFYSIFPDSQPSEIICVDCSIEKENRSSHLFGTIDDCIRCLNCEIGIWNGGKEYCVGA